MGEVNFICGICNHKFFEADDYNIHLKEHDKQDERTPSTPMVPNNPRKETPSDAFLQDTVNNRSIVNFEESMEVAPEKASVFYKCD